MQPSKPIDITVNAVPVGRFTKFAWHREGRFLLTLKRIEISVQQARGGTGHFSAVAHFDYLFSIEKHTGYILINLFGSWLINIGKRQLYVQRIQETE